MRRGIPTSYAGVRFRSRIEARWAIMFDKFQWPWEYEPVDLDGYIPDFILSFPAGPVLVEIKSASTAVELEPYRAKIDRSGWKTANENEALILGAWWGLPDADGTGADTHPAIGLMRQRYGRPDTELPVEPHYCAIARANGVVLGPSTMWSPALLHVCRACRRWSCYHWWGGWGCTVCGAHDGDHYLNSVPRGSMRMWRDAGNAVQWRPA